LSVVIPTYNRPLALKRCVSSVASQRFPSDAFEVVVVDDGSTPPVDRAALEAVPNLAVVRRPHGGAAAARMTGVDHARGGILAFVDDDCTVPGDYLATIERLFGEHPETQVVQVQVVNPDPHNPYGRLWSFNLDGLLRANLRLAPDGRLLSGTLGGVMVARREIFTQVAYDPRLDVALEDADLRYQLQACRIDVHYVPEVRVYHHVPTTLRGYLGQFARYGRGAVHLRAKWGSTPAPFQFCPLTSPRVLRALIRTEGLVGGTALYAVLWLRRVALIAGGAYEVGGRLVQPSSRWERTG